MLDLFSSHGAPLRLAEIAESLQIPPSSAHLLLQELVAEGIVSRVDGHRYEPDAEFFALGVKIAGRLKVRSVAYSAMVALMENTHQDVFLAVPATVGMMYVERVNGPDSRRLDIPMGVPRALHSTAIGQLYLAQLAPERADALIDEIDLVPSAVNTITNRDQLRKRVAETRDRGIACTDEESVDGIVAIAAPILGPSGTLEGALSMSVFATIAKSHAEEFTQRLEEACVDLSHRMGWRKGIGLQQRSVPAMDGSPT